MYNLLIADDNIIYIKSLANIILSRVPSVRLIKIATDGEETYKDLKSEHIDLLLLDLKMPKYSGIEILEKIYNEELPNYPKVIIISGQTEMLKYKYFSKFNVVRCLDKSMGLDNVVKNVLETLSELTEEKKQKYWNECVINELVKLKYNFKHNGTKYIEESIIYILNKRNKSLSDNLEKNVYKHVAELHNKTVGNIKNNIVKATNNMYMECNIDYLLNYFDFKRDTKPTPKIVISTIINKIMKDESLVYFGDGAKK